MSFIFTQAPGPFHFRSNTSDRHQKTIYWDRIDLKKLFTIVEWCYNIEWLFQQSSFSDTVKMELGESAEKVLKRSRPSYQYVDHYQTVIIKGRGRRAHLVPNCVEQQINVQAECFVLRDIFKWKYQLCTGNSWSLRNRGARRGVVRFRHLWEQLYEKIKEADAARKRLQWSYGDVEMVANDLNVLVAITSAGRYDKNAITCFCHKVLNEKVLKRIKNFVDECEVVCEK